MVSVRVLLCLQVSVSLATVDFTGFGVLDAMRRPQPQQRASSARDGEVEFSDGMRIKTFVKEHSACAPKACYCKNVGDVVNNFQVPPLDVTCTEADVLTDAKLAYINEMVADAVAFLSKALRVKHPINNALVTDRCGTIAQGVFAGATADPEHSTTGLPDTDLVVYITAVPAPGATQAWAVSCQWETNSDKALSGRPVVGLMNISPRLLEVSMKSAKPVEYQNSVNTAIHELMHVLGFTSEYFNQEGNQEWFNTSHGKALETDANGDVRMVTPKVVEKAREHFGCPTLSGVLLENQGDAGTSGSHWEKRILGNEVMTGVQTPELTVMSPITLAYFEDTGLYEVDYSMAGNLIWGKGRGCDFVNLPCDKTQISDPLQEFCFPPNLDFSTFKQGCTPSLLTFGGCNVILHKTDPPVAKYQYFKEDATAGGAVTYSDYCPFHSAEVQCTDLDLDGVACQKLDQTACDASVYCYYDGRTCLSKSLDVKGSFYGSGSRCFNAQVHVRSLTVTDDRTARCFRVTCAPDGNSYYAEVGYSSIALTSSQAPRVYCNSTTSLGVADDNFVKQYDGDVPCHQPSRVCSDATLPRASFTMPSLAATGQIAATSAPTEDSSSDGDKMLLIIIIAAGSGAVVLCIICYVLYVPNPIPIPKTNPIFPTASRAAALPKEPKTTPGRRTPWSPNAPPPQT